MLENRDCFWVFLGDFLENDMYVSFFEKKEKKKYYFLSSIRILIFNLILNYDFLFLTKPQVP